MKTFPSLAAAMTLRAATLHAAAHGTPRASGAEITSAVTGNTLQGSMNAPAAHTEFYTADGTAHSPDYKAKWSVEGDTMCWIYDGAAKFCWNVNIKDGARQGTEALLQGTPNTF